jgi:hypothetical protein
MSEEAQDMPALVLLVGSESLTRRLAALAPDAHNRLLPLDPALAALDAEALHEVVGRRRGSDGRLRIVAVGNAVLTGAELASRFAADALVAIGAAVNQGLWTTIVERGCVVTTLASGTLPAEAFLFALKQSGLGATLLAGIADRKPLSPPDAPALLAAAREAAAHRFEVDAQSLYQDAAGALHFTGSLHHLGPRALDLSGPGPSFRIGARVIGADGEPVPGLEGRAALPIILAPGSAWPFRLQVPRFDSGAGDGAIQISLVCDGWFWLSDLGFPPAVLAEQPAPDAIAPVGRSAHSTPRWLLDGFVRLCTPGATVLDLDAGDGSFALAASARVGPAGMVHALVPGTPPADLLDQLAEQPATANLRLLPITASDRLGHVVQPGARPGRIDWTACLPVDLLRPALGRIDLIRLGPEAVKGITGACETIRRDRPLLFLDLRASSGGLADALSVLETLGYTLEVSLENERHSVGAGPWRPWLDRQTSLEPLALCFHPPAQEQSHAFA